MRSFAHKPKASQQTDKSTTPTRPFHGYSSQVNAILHLQRTVGNRVVARLAETEPEANNAETAVPSVVRRVLSSPGQPLDAATRRIMEPRFGHDFSRVRVHHDSLATESAEAVNAHAYTVGSDIVFGRDKYWPGTEQGRSLLAHELTHVVQQRNVNTSAAGLVRLGGLSDDAERHADSSDPYLVLRRAAKSAETWAGKYIADPYDLYLRRGSTGVTVGYGAGIGITFKANSFVDADQIAFVQTAQSIKDDIPVNIYDRNESERKAAESRRVPEGKPGAGSQIDQFPRSRTPLYGMNVKVGGWGNELPEAEPEQTPVITKLGRHSANDESKNKDAWMYDEPMLNSGDDYTPASDVQNGEWSQRFETTALALSGIQMGTFYGSVQWGWSKNFSDPLPHLMEFKTKSENAPSPIFMEAAKLWNASVTSGKTGSIDIPIDGLRTAKDTQLWNSPDKRKKVATLAKGTLLARTGMPRESIFSPGFWLWAKVTVTGGQHAKKTGWVFEADLFEPR